MTAPVRTTIRSVAWSSAALAAPAAAHGPAAAGATTAAALPLALGLLALAAAWLLYLHGSRRRRASVARRGGFHAGAAVLAFALYGPLERLAAGDAAAHMLQHMLLVQAVAPLWAFASPLPQWRAATGARWRPLGRAIAAAGRHPLGLAIAHGALLWLWHLPGPYRLALANPWWHVAEHVGLLASAGLLWWAVVHARPAAVGGALAALLLTLVHTGLLGALLSFADPSRYPGGGAARWQLAGLLMWVPGSLAYLAAAGWVAWRRLLPSRGPDRPRRTASAPAPSRSR